MVRDYIRDALIGQDSMTVSRRNTKFWPASGPHSAAQGDARALCAEQSVVFICECLPDEAIDQVL